MQSCVISVTPSLVKTDPLYICDQCSKSFSTRYNLDAHLKIHDGTEKYVCETCSRRFNNINNYNSHLLVHNEDRTIYQCQVCHKLYLSEQSFKSHIADCGTGVEKVKEKCDQCGNEYADLKDHLKLHESKDTGKKRYTCDMCTVEFNHRMQLHRHRVQTHPDHPALKKN